MKNCKVNLFFVMVSVSANRCREEKTGDIAGSNMFIFDKLHFTLYAFQGQTDQAEEGVQTYNLLQLDKRLTPGGSTYLSPQPCLYLTITGRCRPGAHRLPRNVPSGR
jgi:hypothetical protein